MKNILIIISLVSVFFSACTKEDSEQITPVSNATVLDNMEVLSKTSVPATFTQKLLMEMFASAHCATCPDAELKHSNYAKAYPDKIYGVNLHSNDAMTNPQFTYLDGLLNVTQFSSGSFNRIPVNGVTVLHKTTWKSSVISNCLAKTASCGLMINTSKTATTGTVAVTSGFNKSLSGNYKITVYLVEDKVSGSGSGYNQSNYYNNISSSPFFQLGNPIVGYNHGYVLRKVLSTSLGDAIPVTSIKSGGSYTRNYTFSTVGYNAAQLYVIAFINKTGSNYLTHEIMNVQRVKLGSNKSFD